MRHLRDEIVRVGHLRRGDNILRRRVEPPVGDIVANRAGEEDGVLQDKTDLRAHAVELVVGDIHAIDQHPAGGRVVEARDEAEHGGFAAAGRAADADALAGLDREIDVAQHRGRRVVGKGHMLENNLALELARIARVGLSAE